VANTLAARGREIVYGVTVDLNTGERVAVQTADVGGMAGISALLQAWRDAQPRIVPKPRSVSPTWVPTEWRYDLALSLSLVAPMLIAILLVAWGAPYVSGATVAILGLAILLIVFAIGYAIRARQAARARAAFYRAR
jgi:hypothetical protein